MTERKTKLRPCPRRRPHAGVPDHSRLPARIPDRRVRSGAAADPRNRRQLHDVEHRAGQTRPAVHRDRARSARSRPVRQTPRRLLGGGLRQRHARPAQRARHRRGDGRRALPGRRCRDAVRLPVPATGGTADPGGRRRGDQGRQHRAALRLAADGRRGAGAAATALRAARDPVRGQGRRHGARLDQDRVAICPTCCASCAISRNRPRRRRSPARCGP